MRSAVTLAAVLGGVRADGMLFAETDGAHAIGGNAEGGEELACCFGALFAEAEVVFGGAQFVAVTFDDQLQRGIGVKYFFQEVGVFA